MIVREGYPVYVRVPSMHALGYQDLPGVVSEVLPGNRVNVAKPDTLCTMPVAFGQSWATKKGDFGFILPEDAELMDLNVL